MSRRALVLALGGAVMMGAGAGAILLLHRLNRKLAAQITQLAATVKHLHEEVEELKHYHGEVDHNDEEMVDSADVLQLGLRRQGSSTFFSAVGSSGEEDDEDFMDTVEGSDSEFPATHLEENDNVSLAVADDYTSADESQADYMQGPSQILHKADMLLDGTDGLKQQAFDLLRQSHNKFQTNPDYLWRLAKATYLQSQTEGANGDGERKKSLVYSASKIAKQALELQQDSPNIHKWCAITLGSVGDYESTQVKISNGFKFKEHIETAIQLNPHDPSSHYLLGRWCYGVYMLSWVERKVASTLFATPPTATVDEALHHFLKANELQPGKWKENLLYIGKCYIEKREYNTAVVWLEKAKELPVVDSDDRVAEAEVNTLLSKYSYYKA